VFIRLEAANIREWRASDAALLPKVANNRNISRNLRDAFPYPYTTADGVFFMSLVAKQDPCTLFAIVNPEDEPIGGIGLSLGADVHRLTAELGYWLAESHWGKGIMTDAVRQFSVFALQKFGLVRLHAEPFAYNLASARVLEKAGYVLEGRQVANVIKDGVIIDSFCYALTTHKP